MRMAQAGELQAVADGIEGSLQEALLQASARSNHHALSYRDGFLARRRCTSVQFLAHHDLEEPFG